MRNQTRYNFPKKYHAAIKEVYQDEDGLWCVLNEGYVSGVDQNTICNGEDYGQLISAIKEVKKI